jgi:hypothetical protein
MANGSILTQGPTNRNPTTPTFPYADYGLGSAYQAQIRVMAWCMRNLLAAAMFTPDSYYDGSQISTYLQARAAAATRWLNQAVFISSSTNAYCITAGLFMPVAFVSTAFALHYVFEVAYLAGALGWYYAVSGNTDARDFLRNSTATLYLYILNNYGGFGNYPEYLHSVNGYGFEGKGTGSSPINSADQFALGRIPVRLDWPGSGTAFLITPNSGVTVTAGDKIILDPSQGLPGGGLYAADTPYYVRDVSGNNCNLAPWNGGAGGAAIAAPTGSGSQRSSAGTVGDGGPGYVPLTVAATFTVSAPSASGYMAQVLGVAQILKANGLTSPSLGDLAPVISDAQTRFALNGGVNYNNALNWAMQDSY